MEDSDSSGGAIHYLDGASTSSHFDDSRSRQLRDRGRHHRNRPMNSGKDRSLSMAKYRYEQQTYDLNFTVCGRMAKPAANLTLSLQRKVAACPREFDPTVLTLVLEGRRSYGRTGNQFQTLLNAMQYTRDQNIQLAIVYNSWAMNVILQYFMGNRNGNSKDNWESYFEEMMCVKIIHDPAEAKELKNVALKGPDKERYLFEYQTISKDNNEYLAGQLHVLRTLFQHYNTGESQDAPEGRFSVRNMCSGIDALIDGEVLENRSPGKYTVIHIRYLEGKPGVRLLALESLRTGCDPAAALLMTPDYIKSMLAPLGMLKHPIIVITDGENASAIELLSADPDIGPMLHRVPHSGAWLGGDITLGVMADVFIGNPASTLSVFIAQSRVALGFGNNNMYRARDANGKWETTCRDDCLFRLPQPSKPITIFHYPWREILRQNSGKFERLHFSIPN